MATSVILTPPSTNPLSSLPGSGACGKGPPPCVRRQCRYMRKVLVSINDLRRSARFCDVVLVAGGVRHKVGRARRLGSRNGAECQHIGTCGLMLCGFLRASGINTLSVKLVNKVSGFGELRGIFIFMLCMLTVKRLLCCFAYALNCSLRSVIPQPLSEATST